MAADILILGSLSHFVSASGDTDFARIQPLLIHSTFRLKRDAIFVKETK
jgi:hypothetical protein